jgi:hypothetical protein
MTKLGKRAGISHFTELLSIHFIMLFAYIHYKLIL